jgi:hypothetical protein
MADRDKVEVDDASSQIGLAAETPAILDNANSWPLALTKIKHQVTLMLKFDSMSEKHCNGGSCEQSCAAEVKADIIASGEPVNGG